MVANSRLFDVTPGGLSVPTSAIGTAIASALHWGGVHAPSSERFDGADGLVGHEDLLPGWAEHCDSLAIQHLQRLRRNKWKPPRWVLEEARRADALPAGVPARIRSFEFIRARILEEKRQMLNGFRLFPVDDTVPLGAKKHTVRRAVGYGEAQIFSGGTEFPTAGNALLEETWNVVYVVCAVATNFFETLSTDWAGLRQYEQDLRTARRAVEERINRIIWNGAVNHGIRGVLNYPGLGRVRLATAINNAANGNAIAMAIADAVGHPVIRSGGVYQPTVLAMAPRIAQYLATRQHSTASDTTILEYILAGQSKINGIRRFEIVPELAGVGPDGEDAMLAYRDEVDCLSHVFVQTPTPLPIWRSSPIDTLTVMFAATGGMQANDIGDAVLIIVPNS